MEVWLCWLAFGTPAGCGVWALGSRSHPHVVLGDHSRSQARTREPEAEAQLGTEKGSVERPPGGLLTVPNGAGRGAHPQTSEQCEVIGALSKPRSWFLCLEVRTPSE